MHAKRGRIVAGIIFPPGVIADRSWCGEHDEGEVFFRPQQTAVLGRQLFRQTSYFLIRNRLWNPSQLAALPKTGNVIRKSKESMVKSSAQIGDRGAENKTGIVER
jgi:hypothetical protein